MTGARGRVAYLVNRYPATSHTFIRREIAGVEAAGLDVDRYTLRASVPGDLVHPEDRAERGRTRVILGAGVIASFVLVALARPRRFAAAWGAAWAMGKRAGGGRLRHLAYLAEACALLRRLRRDPVAHLHAHFGSNPAAVALLCRLLGGPPYSFTVHGSELGVAPETQSFDRKAAQAAFVVAVCEHGRARLATWLGPERAARLRVVRCGVDADFLRDAPPPMPARRRLVAVGRLSEEKGHAHLIEAAGRLAAEGADFEIAVVGDGPLRGALEERLRARGLEGRVRLLGWLDGAAVRREIAEAQCFLLPSLREGLPVVLMEAFALGRPAIASAVGGVPELVQPGRTGWLVPPGSPEALAGALREALATPPERLAEMGREGRRDVEGRHDARREAARLAALFLEREPPA